MSLSNWEKVRQDDRYLLAAGTAAEIERSVEDLRGYVHDIVDTLKDTEEEADFGVHAIWNIRQAHDHLDEYVPDKLEHVEHLVRRLRRLVESLRPLLPTNPTDRQIELSRKHYDGVNLEDFESLEAAYEWLDSLDKASDVEGETWNDD